MPLILQSDVESQVHSATFLVVSVHSLVVHVAAVNVMLLSSLSSLSVNVLSVGSSYVILFKV